VAKAPKRAGVGTIVVRREEEGGHGHHGGAWKVAYADFVTAMMAFFLLMWLLNATTQEQRRGIADYFSATPATVRGGSTTSNPWGGKSVFEQGTSLSDRGAVPVMTSSAPPADAEDEETDTVAVKVVHSAQGTEENQAGPDSVEQPGAPPRAPAATGAGRGESTAAELEAASRAIREAILADPALKTLAGQVKIEVTPDGLRIQIVDSDGSPMFAPGSAVPSPRLRGLMHRIVPVIGRLPGAVTLDGHTDASPAAGATDNWDLSAERANAARRLLLADRIPAARIVRVTGHADREPLLAAQPLAPANRRISLTVARSAPKA
jgi:chemotaxis protein MotB